MAEETSKEELLCDDPALCAKSTAGRRSAHAAETMCNETRVVCMDGILTVFSYSGKQNVKKNGRQEPPVLFKYLLFPPDARENRGRKEKSQEGKEHIERASRRGERGYSQDRGIRERTLRGAVQRIAAQAGDE